MTVKKRKVESGGDGKDEGVNTSEEPATKKSRKFSMEFFQERLKENAAAALIEFASACDANEDGSFPVVSEFLTNGGDPLQIVKLLHSASDDHVKEMLILPVFSALKHLLACYMKVESQHQQALEAASWHLLTVQPSIVQQAVANVTNEKVCKAVLTTLAAMATIKSKLAKEVLTCMNFSSMMARTLARKTSSGSTTTVRTCFIHLLMAFLITDDVDIIELLCKKKGVLVSVIPDLVADPADTVLLYLTTVRFKLVEQQVSKSSKMSVFISGVLRNLLKLYYWVGPVGQRTEDRASKQVFMEVDEDSRGLVANAVHDLLLVLLTSHKHGLISHGKKTISNKKYTHLVKTVLEEVKEPWENELQWELVLKTLINCPGLVANLVSHIEPFLEPRNSLKWYRAMSFYKQLVESLNPKVCKQSREELLGLLVMLVAPPAVLKVVSGESLLHLRLSLRNELASLLCTMLRATERFLNYIKIQQLPGAMDLRAEMTAHLVKHLPSGSVLVKVWEKAFDKTPEEEEDEEVDVVRCPSLEEHVLVLLDLFEVYKKCCPGELSSSVLDSHKLLADVLSLSLGSNEIVRALDVVFTLNPSGFYTEKELFKTAVTLLLDLVVGPHSSTTQRLLLELLHRTGIFVADSSELVVWLHCYLNTHSNAKPTVQRLLTDALVLITTNPRPFVNTLSAAAKSASQHGHCPYEKDLDKVLQELLDGGSVSEEVRAVHSNSTLSILLPGVLQLAAEGNSLADGVVEYISCVVVHLLHEQASAGVIWHLLEQRKHLVVLGVWKYVRGWLPEFVPVPLRKPFAVGCMERKLSRLLLQPHETSVEEIFGDVLSYVLDKSETQVTVDISSLPVKDSFQTVMLLKLVLFHVVQQIGRNSFTKELCENFQQSLLCLLFILRTLTASQATEVGIRFKETFVKNYFKYFFTHPAMLSAFKLSKKADNELVVQFVIDVKKIAGKMVSQNIFAPLRQEVVRQTFLWLKECHENSSVDFIEEKCLPLLEHFRLEQTELMELLEVAAILPTELLYQHESNQLSLLGLLLAFLLQKISLNYVSSTGKSNIVLQNVVKNVARHLISLQDRQLTDIAQLEEGFLQFIKTYPHHLAYIKKNLLKGLLKNPKRSGSAVKICVFLVERKKEFVSVFSSYMLKRKRRLKSSACVFAVLSAALSHGPDTVDESLLHSVYECHKTVIHRAVVFYTTIREWVEDNISTIIMLLDTCMGAQKCKELCEQAADKCVIQGVNHQKLLHNVFVRASREGEEGALAAWCSMLLSATVRACKEQNKAMLVSLCSGLRSCVTLAGAGNLQAVLDNEHWAEFMQQALAVGLEHTPRLLDALTELSAILYQDAGNHPQAVEMFGMLVSHARFLPTIIKAKLAKRSVIELLLVITKKAPSVMNSSHIATFLGAYGATLSITDQLILKLLHQYESCGISLQKYRPYLWGEAALIQYSVRSKLASALSQQPTVWQVLELFTPAMVTSTISDFPLARQLDVTGELHAKKPQLYDPAFFLPLLSHLLSPENLVPINKVHQCGALALCIGALSSEHQSVRHAACYAISLFYFTMEGNRQQKEKQIWLQLVDALRDGMPEGQEVPQLPSVITVYLARATFYISNPLNSLCVPLVNYVCLRPAFDLHKVPDFLRLFHSNDVHFRDHRQFILEVLRSGIRRQADFNLVHKAVVYKMLMTFYSSILADETCKVLILQVMHSSVKVPKAASILVSSYGLLSWLHDVVAKLQLNKSQRTIAALRVLCDLCTSLGADLGPVSGLILKLLLALLPNLRSDLRVSFLDMYLRTLCESAAAAQLPGLLTLADVTAVLQYCRAILGSLRDLEDLLMIGPQFASQKIQKVKTKELASARLHLRSFILIWLNQTSQPT